MRRALAVLSTTLLLGLVLPLAMRARGDEPAKTDPAKPADAAPSAATSVGSAPAASAMVLVMADQVKWADAPPAFPAGAKAAFLEGDPSKAGLFTARLRLPDGYQVPAHWHSQDEHITVLSGTLHLGMGDKLDKAQGQTLTAGSYANMPARMHHYAWAAGETVIQVHGQGPFDITYINPADDPRGASKGAVSR